MTLILFIKDILRNLFYKTAWEVLLNKTEALACNTD